MDGAMWLRLLAAAVLAAAVASDPCSRSEGGADVVCRVRALDDRPDALQAAEGAERLRVDCSEPFAESAAPTAPLQRLPQLQELTLRRCKIGRLERGAFAGPKGLRKVAVNTLSGEWSAARSLDISDGAFAGLRELQHLDLADNNLRALPRDVFCPLANLQTLNLTRNRLRSADQLGFGAARQPDCAGSDLLALDLSGNDFRALAEPSGLARLRRLQQLNLAGNNISRMSAEALDGLVSLRVLDLAANALQELPQDLFSGCRELREIHLQNNSLESLARGVFHRLEQLLVLDLSNNQLTSGHINAGTFQGLIRLIVLNLSHNALTRIESKTFKDLYFLHKLDLRNNSIGFIEDNAFLPLYNLDTLNLAENRLNTIGPLLFNGLFVLSKLVLNNNLIVNVHQQAFKNCSALKELDLSSNALDEVPDALHELSFLKTLDLGENQISEFRNGSFRSLQQLTGLRLIENNIGNLSKGMLWDLPSLQVLNLAKNKVQSIERGTFDRNTQLEAIRLDGNYLSDINGVFATLASLLWLNLSGNHLVWFDYAFIPSNLKWLDIHNNYIEHLANYYKIQDGIRVKTLDASHNRILEVSAMSVPDSVELLFINNNQIGKVHANTFLEKRSLVRVDMYANEIVSMDLNSFRLQPVPENASLPEFYIGGNPFHCDCNMEWLQTINNKSATRQYPRIMDLDNVLCRMTYSRGMSHMPLTTSRPGDFLCRYETHCFTVCTCCEYDACDCEMTCPQNCSCYHDQTWNTNVVDCSGQGAFEIPHRIPMDASEVYLDGNDFRELPNHAFIGRRIMRVLFVNASGVETIQNRTFNGLNALQTLHLEDNRIAELKGYEFEHLVHLRELYLHNNRIQFVGNGTLAPLRSLELLRLDGNRLASFPVWQLSLNPRLGELALGNNRWSCRCKFLQQMMVWVAENAAKVVDASDLWCAAGSDGQRRELDLNDTECSDYYGGALDDVLVSDYLPAMVVLLVVVVLLLVGLVAWFGFKESLRVWIYSRYGVRLFAFKAAAGKRYADDREKLYDGYVCYSPKDEEFVVQSIAAELENGNPAYQLCLHYRDLPHAAYLQHAAPAVLEAAEASRRVILVLTRNFLQTEWARYELRQALHEALKGRVFKLVLLEEGPALPEAELDPDLRPYLKTGHRVRWGERRFWEKLKYAMPETEQRGKINANYRRNINNYTLESSVVSNGAPHHAHQEKAPASASPSLQMQIGAHPLFRAAQACDLVAPPAYSRQPRPQEAPLDDEANYSSATTATPSPRPARRSNQHHHHQQQQQQQQQQQLQLQQQPLQQQHVQAGGEHRPLSDHIYSSIDSDYSTLERGGSGRRHGSSWRQGQQPNGVQAYLV